MKTALFLFALIAVASAGHDFGPKTHYYQFFDMPKWWVNEPEIENGIDLVPVSGNNDFFSFTLEQNTEGLQWNFYGANMDNGFRGDFRAAANSPRGFTLDFSFLVREDCAPNTTGAMKLIHTPRMANSQEHFKDFGVYVVPCEGGVVLQHRGPKGTTTGTQVIPINQFAHVIFDYSRESNYIKAYVNDVEDYTIEGDYIFDSMKDHKVTFFRDDGYMNKIENRAGAVDFMQFHSWCAEGEYFDECDKKCYACACGCKTCWGPSHLQCITCPSGYYQSTVPVDCSMPQFQLHHATSDEVYCPDQACIRCQNTMPHCVECNWHSSCSCCEPGWKVNEWGTGCVVDDGSSDN